MECFFILLGLVVAAALLVGPVVGAVTMARSRRTERRLRDLELEISRLARQVRSAAASPKAPAAVPTASPAPASPSEVRVREEAPDARDVKPPAEPPAPPPDAPAPEPPPPVAASPEQPPPPTSPEPPGPEEPILPSRPAFDWEQWIGVRGAAVLGGVLFALAGLYFVRFAIEEGWLAPPVRVALGLLAGLAAVVGSEALRRRGYEPTANAVAGGGLVVLYAAVWAGHALYGLFPAALAFGSMIVVTAAAGVIAWRHRSQVVAVLGLAGGFATPLLLEIDPDRPLSLFGYLLVLDLALVLLARRRRWPLLAPLGLLATVSYQALWICTRMTPGELFLGLAVLAVFAALFALAASRPAREEPRAEEAGEPWEWTRFGAVAAPFAFALYLAVRADLGPHLWPVAILMLILSVAAEALDRGWPRAGGPPGAAVSLGPVVAGASVAVVAAWTLRWTQTATIEGAGTAAVAWEAVAISAALAAAFHVFAELDLRRGRESTTMAPPVAAGGLLALVGLASVAAADASSGLPWIAGWTVLAALLVRQGCLPAVHRRPVVAAALVGLVYPLFHLAHAGEGLRPEPPIYFALLLASGAALQILALLRRRTEAVGRWADVAALALPVAALAGLFGQAVAGGVGELTGTASAALPSGLFLGLALALAVLAVLAATRLGYGWAYLAVVLLLAWDQLVWSAGATGEVHAELLPLAAGAVLFTAWPFLAGPRLREHPATWWGAALAAPAAFPALLAVWLGRWGDGAVGLLPVLLGTLALAAASRARGLWPAGDPGRLRTLAWFGAAALGFAAIAVPLQLEREWITVGWALEGVAVVALWRRLDHAGLKYFGLALLAAVTVRLVANPEVLVYHPRSGLPVLNWLAYTYLVPAATLVGASVLLARHEVERARPVERGLYRAGRPTAALVTGFAAVVVVFVWINLAVFDLFSTGTELTLGVARTMARDLTLSLAWALYALVLLSLGIARGTRGLRGLGLGLLTLTVVKVFLYDLAGLEDLYRVASLAGLAVSLVMVSLAYQRFVFRKAPAAPEGD